MSSNTLHELDCQDLPRLNPQVFGEKESFREQFNSATPFRHLLIQDVLERSWLERFRRELNNEELTRESDEFYTLSSLSLDEAKSPMAKLWSPFFVKEMLPLIEQITLMTFSHLWVPMNLFRFGPNERLAAHNDFAEHRALAYVLNLSEFAQDEGGRLLLLKHKGSNQYQVAKAIPHLFNSLVLFETTATSFHQIEPLRVSGPRVTIAGWLMKESYDFVLKHQLDKLRVGTPANCPCG